jgi:hypothetical protein
MYLYKSEYNAFYLVVIAFINFITMKISGDGRIPVKERIISDIREPRLCCGIRLFYITFYIARVTVAVRNQKKNVWERQEVHRYIHSFLPA